MFTHQKLLVGCVADDFTGAGDAASFLAAGGIPTVLISGIPNDNTEIPLEFGAVVIALKSRTQATAAAVSDTLAAVSWLQKWGVDTLYFKYCSTFDSTPHGNIGPVADSILGKCNTPYSILCPALPVNKRTVRDGILYVADVPLAQSHMKNHPLTPMWESDITKLMEPQSKYPTFKINAQLLGQPKELQELIALLQQKNPHFYLCVDYYLPEHGEQIANNFANLPFLTGGSGLLKDLAAFKTGGSRVTLPSFGHLHNTGGRVLLAGSCSVATKEQVQRFLQSGGHGYLLNPKHLLDKSQSVEEAWSFLQTHRDKDVLIYSAGSGGILENTDAQAADILEKTLAELARRAVQSGCTRLIVAGGETSGAVTQALGYHSFYIGESVAPGVPIMVPAENTSLRLVLKSGNFGDPDFFLTTLA